MDSCKHCSQVNNLTYCGGYGPNAEYICDECKQAIAKEEKESDDSDIRAS